MNRDVTVVIPSIPQRHNVLNRAMRSVGTQTQPAAAVSIAIDLDGSGSGPTRTRALRAATTTWVAFLDDDDEFMPHHLSRLLELAEEGGDVIVPWFVVMNPLGEEWPEGDPFPHHRGKAWSLDDPHIFPITCLVRNEVAQLSDFPMHIANGKAGDDFAYWCALGKAGADIRCYPDQTWWWQHHGRNCSGLPANVRSYYGAFPGD